MAIPRYAVEGMDFEVIPFEDGDFYKGDDVVAAIRKASDFATKEDVVYFLADKFGIDMTDVEA